MEGEFQAEGEERYEDEEGETLVISGEDEEVHRQLEAHRAARRRKAEKMQRVMSAVRIANSLTAADKDAEDIAASTNADGGVIAVTRSGSPRNSRDVTAAKAEAEAKEAGSGRRKFKSAATRK